MLVLSCKTIYLYYSLELVYLSIGFVTIGIRTSIRNNCKWYASTCVWLESIKKMEVICKSFHLARKYKKNASDLQVLVWLDMNKRHQLKRVVGNAQPKKRIWEMCNQREEWIWLREQEKLTKGNDGQCKLEDKKDMGALQNQIIPTNFKLG